jgi:hypothetical protein
VVPESSLNPERLGCQSQRQQDRRNDFVLERWLAALIGGLLVYGAMCTKYPME